MQIGGYLVPKGTEVITSSWSLHYNTRVWGADAACWRPDRWLEGGSVAAARKDADGHLRFQPFLTGPSNCIGQHLALVRLLLQGRVDASFVHLCNRKLRCWPHFCVCRGRCGPRRTGHVCEVQAELKMLVASLLSRLHVTLDAERMAHLCTVEDYVGETLTRITLQRSSPCWLRMQPRVPA